MNKKYDLIIVGAGPSGVFTAYELIELGLAKDKKILLVEQGKAVEKRNCPVEAINGEPGNKHEIDQSKCIKCGTCVSKCPFHAIK